MMKIFHNQLRHALSVIESYDGKIPLSAWLKSYFKQHSKYGSRDRKRIAKLCYGYYRLGHSLKKSSMEERMMVALYVCHSQPDEILQVFKPLWNVNMQLSLEQKIQIASIDLSVSDIFPWRDEMSNPTMHESYCHSLLRQPALFLRIRPGYEATVSDTLKEQGIVFEEPRPGCIALANATKVEHLFEINKQVVIQDFSSQRVAESLELAKSFIPVSAETMNGNMQTIIDNVLSSSLRVWDCCAGSGGKSILVRDLLGPVQLTVSDIRSSILENLTIRLKQAGIGIYDSFVADLTQPSARPGTPPFDLVVADVPCSGSGVWGRTPEAMHFFHASSLDNYNRLQKKIVSNLFGHVKKNGIFLYITCSVFKAENEDIVEFIVAHSGMQLMKLDLLSGYAVKADTLFVAVFKN